LIKNFLSYIGLSAAAVEQTPKTTSGSEYTQPKRIINVYYDPTQTAQVRKKPGDHSNTSSFAIPIEESKDHDPIRSSQKQALSESIRNDSGQTDNSHDMSSPYFYNESMKI